MAVLIECGVCCVVLFEGLVLRIYGQNIEKKRFLMDADRFGTGSLRLVFMWWNEVLMTRTGDRSWIEVAAMEGIITPGSSGICMRVGILIVTAFDGIQLIVSRDFDIACLSHTRNCLEWSNYFNCCHFRLWLWKMMLLAQSQSSAGPFCSECHVCHIIIVPCAFDESFVVMSITWAVFISSCALADHSNPDDGSK